MKCRIGSKRKQPFCGGSAQIVRLAELQPKAGMRVVDGLQVKEYAEGVWFVVCEAGRRDIAEYPTVVD